ncbi:UNVERIFIED_CONTAM: hypothetical protein Sindi_2494800, partial [Sesamum indicum]
SKYVNDILTDLGLLEAKTTNTPLPPGIKFTTKSNNLLPHPAVYRRMVGRFLYLSFTRLDIDAVVHLVKYLKGTSQKVFKHTVMLTGLLAQIAG